MRDSEALLKATLSLLDVVEELADAVGKDEWPEAVRVTFREHRRELRGAVPDRLVRACGDSEEAAEAVLRVLERASSWRRERPSEAAMREADAEEALRLAVSEPGSRRARSRVRIALPDEPA